VIDRRSLMLAGGAGIAQLGQRVLPRITLPALLDQSHVPALGGAVITPKGIVGLEAIGRRRSGQKIPVTAQDLWLIGSNTQAMTAALYARVAESGRVRWGAKVPDLFPDLTPEESWRDVTIEELMAHVAGVSDEPFATPEALHKWLNDTRSLPAQRTAFAKAVLAAPPVGRRGDYVFSNAGYVLVGAAIERATKMDWETAISAELFGPLGMDSAGFGAPTGDQPWGHARLDEKHNLQVNPAAEADDPPVFGPASRVHLSLEDYAKFVRIFLTNGGDYLQPRSLPHIASPIVDDPTGPAPGWLVSTERSWAQGPVLTQRSYNGYWSSTAMIGPAKGLAVIAVCNAGGADFGGSAVQRMALSLIQKFAAKS